MTIVEILEKCLDVSATFGQIQNDLNYSKTTLSGVLKNLLDTRRLRRVEFGLYQITETGAEYLEEKYSKIVDEQTRRITLASVNILNNHTASNLIPVWPVDDTLLSKQEDKIKVSHLFDLLLHAYERSVSDEYGKFLDRQTYHFVSNYAVLTHEKMCQLTWLSFKTKSIPQAMHRILNLETDGFSDLERIEKICDRKVSEKYIFNVFRFFSLPVSARRIYLRDKSKILGELGIINE